jgi:hypothetical protein
MQGDIASQQVEDVGGVGALWTRALEVGLATKLVRQRPPHSIDDEPAFHLEDDVPKKGHSTRQTDVASYPSSGGRIGLEKTRECSVAGHLT